MNPIPKHTHSQDYKGLGTMVFEWVCYIYKYNVNMFMVAMMFNAVRGKQCTILHHTKILRYHTREIDVKPDKTKILHSLITIIILR